LHILITYHIARDNKLARLWQVDNTARRKLGGPEVEPKSTAVGKMAVAVAARPGNGNARKGAEEAEMRK
jgi:hypothetical protein